MSVMPVMVVAHSIRGATRMGDFGEPSIRNRNAVTPGAPWRT
jgi:hypothetical protein